MVNVFQHVLTLKFKSKQIEKCFWMSINKSFPHFQCIIAIFVLIISIMNIINLFVFQESNESMCSIKIISIIELCLRLVFSILSISFRKKKTKYVFNCFIYFLLTVVSFAWNISAYQYEDSKKYEILIIINCMDFMIRIFYFCSSFLSYISILIIHTLSLVFVLTLSVFLNNSIDNSQMHKKIIYGYSMYFIVFTFISYPIEYFKKVGFFYKQEVSKLTNNNQTIYDEISSGIVFIRDNKVSYVNKWLQEKLNLERYLKVNGGEDVDNYKEKFLMNELLGNMKNAATENEFTVLAIEKLGDNGRSMNNNDTQTNILSTMMTRMKSDMRYNSKDFQFIGVKTSVVDEIEIKFEVYCRRVEADGSDNLDFIFNEIPKKEEKVEDNRINPVFLAKVAHEFKNPLICIIELVHQLSDNLKKIRERRIKTRRSSLSILYNPQSNNNNYNLQQTLNLPEISPLEKEINENLHQINSLSNYLIILIKDFDFFSQKKACDQVRLDVEEFVLEEILIFCREVAVSLLKKNEKLNDITLDLELDNNVPSKITTDQFKLKQILINLLSNAIKFTTEGKIRLKVTRNDNDVVFSVEDTGVGIKDSYKNQLFQPYKLAESNKLCCGESSGNNKLGAGLGLSIVKDLSNLLGKGIQYTSEVNKGSKFWFSVPIKKHSTRTLISKSSSNNPLNRNNSGKNSHEVVSVKFSSNRIKRGAELKNTVISKTNALMKTLGEEDEEAGKIRRVKSNNPYKDDFSNSCSSINVSISNNNGNSIREGASDSDEHNKETVRIDNPVLTIDKGMIQYEGENIKVNENEYVIKVTQNNVMELNVRNSISSNFPFMMLKSFNESKGTGDCLKRGSLSLERIDCSTPSNFISDGNLASRSGLVLNINEYVDKSFRNLKSEKEKVYNIIIADDEKFTRMSTRRTIKDYCEQFNITVNVLEAEDGIDCLFCLFSCVKKGINISFVLSDQTMTYLHGANTAYILKNLCSSDKLKEIPFFIITAYEDVNTLNNISKTAINNVYTKPLNKASVEQIFSQFLPK